MLVIKLCLRQLFFNDAKPRVVQAVQQLTQSHQAYRFHLDCVG